MAEETGISEDSGKIICVGDTVSFKDYYDGSNATFEGQVKEAGPGQFYVEATYSSGRRQGGINKALSS